LAYIANIHDNPDLFLKLSYIAQSIGGVGSGLNSVCSMALLIAHSPKKDRD